MQDFLQQIDLDYYRSALLLVARADLQRLRQEKIPLGASPSADSAAVQVSPKMAR